MISVQKAFYSLKSSLETIYDTSEAEVYANSIMELITQKNNLDRLLYKNQLLNTEEYQLYKSCEKQALAHVPLQYIVQKAWFYKYPFKVNSDTLIPRPETEELVDWIKNDVLASEKTTLNIMDIGTGTGAIAISIKLLLPQTNVSAVDISAAALKVAQENATTLQTDVHFLEMDFLDESTWAHFRKYDIIVSNPPYIPQEELGEMPLNVTKHEPHLALFVPNAQPLLFYEKLADFGLQKLETGGFIYCEIHQDSGSATKILFEQKGYKDVILRKDIYGNDRMIKACF